VSKSQEVQHAQFDLQGNAPRSTKNSNIKDCIHSNLLTRLTVISSQPNALIATWAV